MFVPLWLIAAAGLAFALLAWLALRPRGERTGSGRDMLETQRRSAGRSGLGDSRPPPADQLDLLARPEIRGALESGRKIEAIKLLRERSGLGLREAKELVERHARR